MVKFITVMNTFIYNARSDPEELEPSRISVCASLHLSVRIRLMHVLRSNISILMYSSSQGHLRFWSDLIFCHLSSRKLLTRQWSVSDSLVRFLVKMWIRMSSKRVSWKGFHFYMKLSRWRIFFATGRPVKLKNLIIKIILWYLIYQNLTYSTPSCYLL